MHEGMTKSFMASKSGIIELSSLDKHSCQLQCSSLLAARNSGTINVQELSELLFGGPKNIQTFLRISKLVEEIPEFSKENRYNYGRTEVQL